MKSKRVLSILLCGLLLAQAAYTTPVIAVGNSIYLSPSTQSVTKDATFTVSVRITTSTSVNAVQANLSYPSSQMTYLSTSYSGSAFDKSAESWGGGGSIQIARHTPSTVSGDQLVAVLSFKTVAPSGTGTISVQNSSALTSDDGPVSTTYGSSTISFGPTTIAAGPPAANTAITKAINPRAAVTSTQKPAPDTTPPVITNTKSEQATTKSQIISWTTNEVSSSLVEYGVDDQYGLSMSDNAMVTDHIITLSSAFLLPNLQFHYRVTSTDASGNTQHGPDLTFKTSGIFYNVTVVDKHGKPLPDAVITLNGQTVYTDDSGKASLATSAGKQTVKITYNSTTTSKTITVGLDKAQQIDTVQLAAQRNIIDVRYLDYPLLILLGLAIGIGSRIRVRKYLLAAIRGERTSLLALPISSMQQVFGDPNPAHNPYREKRRFSIWSIPNFLVRLLGHKAAKTPKRD